jgi:hypothetical protein
MVTGPSRAKQPGAAVGVVDGELAYAKASRH